MALSLTSKTWKQRHAVYCRAKRTWRHCWLEVWISVSNHGEQGMTFTVEENGCKVLLTWSNFLITPGGPLAVWALYLSLCRYIHGRSCVWLLRVIMMCTEWAQDHQDTTCNYEVLGLSHKIRLAPRWRQSFGPRDGWLSWEVVLKFHPPPPTKEIDYTLMEVYPWRLNKTDEYSQQF
jgi:hypothetical protein